MAEDYPSLFIRGRLNGSQRNKMKGLLNMMYSPRELAEEIAIEKDQIYRVYIPEGCPHVKDRMNHILINGIAFKVWYQEKYAKRQLDRNQAYCVSCKRIIEMMNPEIVKKGNLIFYLCTCPNCGNRATRFIDCKRKKNDQ